MQKGLVFMIRAGHVTGDILKDVLRNFLNDKTPERGQTTISNLEKSGIKLNNIEVTENNIGSFLQTARKYNIDYALKRDKSTAPPTWYVFFKTGEKSVDTFKRAFSEYTANIAKQSRLDKPGREKNIERKKSLPHRDVPDLEEVGGR